MPGAARFVSYRRSEGSRWNAAVLFQPDQWQNRHFAGNGDSALESLRQHARNMDQDAGRLRSGASAQTSKTDSGGALRASASGVNRRREILRDHFPHATKAEADVPEFRTVPDAERSTRAHRKVVPGPSAQHPVTPAGWSRWVRLPAATGIRFGIPIGGPFKHITQQIVKTEFIGSFLANRIG